MTILSQLPKRLPPGWKISPSPIVDILYSLVVDELEHRPNAGCYLIYVGAERLTRTADLDEALELLESDLHFLIALRARHSLFVHAGVVGWRERAIVMPGRSLSGKTTLVETLVRAGATYYSDEYAVFDARGRVHPYPKSLSIRGGLDNRSRKCAVESIGGSCGIRPLPVGLIVVTTYQSKAEWQPRVLSPGQALLELLDNTILARARPKTALATLRRAALLALTLKSKRGEAKDIHEALLDNLCKSQR